MAGLTECLRSPGLHPILLHSESERVYVCHNVYVHIILSGVSWQPSLHQNLISLHLTMHFVSEPSEFETFISWSRLKPRVCVINTFSEPQSVTIHVNGTWTNSGPHDINFAQSFHSTIPPFYFSIPQFHCTIESRYLFYRDSYY